MRRRVSAVLIVLVVLAAVGSGGTWAAFSATTATGPMNVSSAADWTAPSVDASVIANTSSGPGVKQGGTYNVYANASDTGNPASGVSTVRANVANVTAGQTNVTLSACASSCTVGAVTYAYKSAQLTANAALAAGSVNYTVTATDVAANASSATTFSVTVDNTAPTVSAAVAAHSSTATRVKASGTYYVFASATDASTGVSTVTANVANLTTGQTAVTLSTCSSACTVAGVTYAYKSAQLTASAGITAGTKTFTVTAVDAAGNSSSATSFNATVDNTAPTATDVQTANGGATAGKPELADTVTLTFSEQMDPDTIVSGWSGASMGMAVRISNAGGASNDIVTFWNAANTTQLTALGSVNLGRAGYVNTGATISFGASGTASTMVQAAAVVTVTLGTPSATANTVANTTTMSWVSSTIPADLAGNAASGNTRSETGVTADKEF
jgi:predicted ribosomally synthesized peptide with SipW-like signal peptide